MTESHRAVVIALIVDVVVTVAKLVAYVMTGSVVLMAELLHSLVGTVNQGLLAVGIARSRRPADASHPYGFGRSRYVWALLSAAGILFLGSGMALIEGAEQVLWPTALRDLQIGFVVLAGSAVAEATSLGVALVAIRGAAREDDMSFLEFLRGGDDPTAVAVVLEDGAAVIGVAVATTAIGLASLTGDARWDGVGSVLVGLLLAGSAVFLIDRNRHLLLDPAVPPDDIALAVQVIEENPVVEEIRDVKATQLGVDHYRLKAEVTFDGHALAGRVLAEQDLEAAWANLDGPDDLEELMVGYGARVVNAVGSEVDRIEDELTRLIPELRHVDLEPEAEGSPPDD